jgi:hypothetical protein
MHARGGPGGPALPVGDGDHESRRLGSFADAEITGLISASSVCSAGNTVRAPAEFVFTTNVCFVRSFEHRLLKTL